jgi:SAM-dependent methyltransferase
MNKNVSIDPKYGYKKLDPIPTQDEVEKFYAKEFYDANASYFNNSALEIQKEQGDFFNSRWETIYQICKAFYDNNLEGKSVFDIGFGFAQALLYLKDKGLVVSGLEPSIEGVNYAKQNGIKAFHSGIESFECVGDEKFDIVLLVNVLEHLREPEETINNIKNQLLTSNGLLVIDVPNDFNLFQEIADEEYNLNQWWVVNPNHINYFSPDSLKKLVEGCGFEIVDYEAAFPLDIFLLFGDQYIGDAALGRECHNKRVNFERLMRKHNKHEELKALYKSFADLNLGRSITIYATPKK